MLPAAGPDCERASTRRRGEPPDRAGGSKILAPARKHGLDAAGAFSTEEQELCIVNSRGVSAYHRGTVASILTVVMSQDSSGYAADASIDVSRIDPAAVGKTAIDKALQSRNPTSVEPGSTRSSSKQEAVADMLFFLGYMGMSAGAAGGRSFMCGKLASENITVWDDGLDLRGCRCRLRAPSRRHADERASRETSSTTRRPRRRSRGKPTGHSLPALNTQGPLPINLFMAPGDVTKENAGLHGRGIW
jgi:hypothetical protein